MSSGSRDDVIGRVEGAAGCETPFPAPPHKGEGSSAGKNVDWAAVREAYELSDETVSSIRERFGLSRYQLERQRTLDGWTVRPQIARNDVLRQRGHSIGGRGLELRLNRLVTVGLEMLEKRVIEEGITEANARTLTELLRALEIRMRSKRNEKAAKAREKKSNDAGYDFRDDRAWLEAELNRRLDGLGRQGEAAASPRADEQRGDADLSRGVEELGAA